MMGLNSMGSGGGNSSTSNLSASAPPFTVDRLNPKPNSNPLLHYSDSPYVVEPFSHPSQYAHLSAPRPEPAIDSSEIISAPVSDGYRFSASASVSPSSTQWPTHNSGYGGDAKPYYSPYVPPLLGEDRLLVEDEGSRYNVAPAPGLNGTSQHDYSRSLFDLEYPRWADSLGFDDGKRAKRSEVDGKFSSEKLYVGSSGSHGYENQLYRGGHGSENRNKFKQDSGALYKNLNQVSEREVYTGSSSTRYMEDKSCLEQQLGFFQYDSSKSLLTSSSSSYPESYPSVTSCAMEKSFPNYQNSCSPYEKCVRPVDTPFPGRVSVIRSSPTVVIRPPPATNHLGQGTTRKPAGSENAAGIHIVDSDYTSASKPKDSGLKPNSKPKDDSFETSLFKFSKQGNSPVSSTSVKELSSPLHSKDTSYCKFKATLGSQIPDVNASSGFPMADDNIKVVNFTEESSELIDHHNTAEDSPCWKGAPSSQFSMFDIEAGNLDHAKINLDEHYRFGHGERQSLHSTVDSNRVFSEKVECNMGNENECGSNGVTLGLEKTLDAICSTTEQSLFDGTTDRVWIPPATRTKGVELGGGPNMMTKEPNLLNNFTNVFDMKVSDPKHLFGEGGVGMTVNDVSEGAAVAVHVAEKVLSSPASQDDAIEHTTVPDPRLDVPTIVKAIHSLSELLRYHISIDICSLGEENTGTLMHIVSNLNTCLSKKGVQAQATSKPEPKDPVGETSRILGESCSVGIISGGPHAKCEASSSGTKPDHMHLRKGERNYVFPGKKDEISPTIPPLRDDLHLTGDDDMAKAIKNILEQNFQMKEDMHSQALLFKSLWLEAEAKLCSISYKARFERTKIQMEEIELKAPKENEDIAEMTKLLCISPDPIIMSELAPKACGGTFPKPTSPNVATSGMIGHANDIEASVLTRFNILRSREDDLNLSNTEEQQESEMVDSKNGDSVMARFSILKFRENNPKPLNTEEQQQSQIVDSTHADSVMARFNILKSREDNLKLSSTEEQQQSEMVDSKHADSVMARFNILRSREENSKLIGVDVEKPPQVINDEFAGEKYFRPCVRGQSEDEALDVALQPDFQYPTGSLTGGKFDSYFERSGYESPIEHSNDPAIQLLKSSIRMINENNSGWRDSSSSEWEHVLKEDFTWKNY
ncbi:hypothetical protein C2S51_025368 [Perilla frutescens var. frutescens]|nr:hypothetical protein C2S51_025368 [Perilla frutescens var. frutescens]